MEWMLMAWHKFADFSGRARRKEYWMFVLGVVIVSVVLQIIDGIVGTAPYLAGLFSLAALVPSIAVGVRRLHDQDKSGWFMLLGLIPLVGIVLLVFMCLEGTSGPNQYGPDPKAG